MSEPSGQRVQRMLLVLSTALTAAALVLLFSFARASPHGEVVIVAVYSWNEYHERSMIEPHRDAAAPGKGLWPYRVAARYAAILEC